MDSVDGSFGKSFPCLTALNDGTKLAKSQALALEHLDALPDEPMLGGHVKLSFEEIANVIEAEYDQL